MNKKEMKEWLQLQDIKEPCKGEVARALQDKRYSYANDAKKKIFLTFKDNKEIEDILIKTICVNQFDSTNVKYIEQVAKSIQKINKFDDHLRNKDLLLEEASKLVKKIAQVQINDEKKIYYYSFATKYFSHHFDGKYPIYDWYISKMLWYFNDRYDFMDKDEKFSEDKLKDYKFLNTCIDLFIEKFGLSDYTKRDIDKYLWLMGKDYLEQIRYKPKPKKET